MQGGLAHSLGICLSCAGKWKKIVVKEEYWYFFVLLFSMAARLIPYKAFPIDQVPVLGSDIV